MAYLRHSACGHVRQRHNAFMQSTYSLPTQCCAISKALKSFNICDVKLQEHYFIHVIRYYKQACIERRQVVQQSCAALTRGMLMTSLYTPHTIPKSPQGPPIPSVNPKHPSLPHVFNMCVSPIRAWSRVRQKQGSLYSSHLPVMWQGVAAGRSGACVVCVFRSCPVTAMYPQSNTPNMQAGAGAGGYILGERTDWMYYYPSTVQSSIEQGWLQGVVGKATCCGSARLGVREGGREGGWVIDVIARAAQTWIMKDWLAMSLQGDSVPTPSHPCTLSFFIPVNNLFVGKMQSCSFS